MRSRGFTIVEVLVVIIVIAILASISVVSYVGVRDRAVATKTMALVEQWETTIRLFQINSGKLPNDWTCLGNDVSDFPADHSVGIGPGQCERNFVVGTQASTWTSEYKTVPTPGQSQPTSQLLRRNASLAPGLLDQFDHDGGAYMRGIIYASIYEPQRAPQGKPGAFIFYALKGQPCGQGFEHRVLGPYRVCAIRLTTDNYANEIVAP